MSDAVRFLRAVSMIMFLLALSACAANGQTRRPDPRDPMEGFNRSMYGFNSAVDRGVLRPVAKAYHDHVPRFMQTGLSNFLDNLETPNVMVNDFLQGKMVAGLADMGRLLLNSTLGLGGLLDPASAAGLDKNDEDWGQTFGRWGVPSGPYVVLPLFGPSTLRDAPLLYVDSRFRLDEIAEYYDYKKDDVVSWGLLTLYAIDTRAQLLSTDQMLKRAFDEYSFVRDAWLQRREYLVRDGDVPEEPIEEYPDEGDTSEQAPPKDESGDETPPSDESAAGDEHTPAGSEEVPDAEAGAEAPDTAPEKPKP